MDAVCGGYCVGAGYVLVARSSLVFFLHGRVQDAWFSGEGGSDIG